MGERSEWVLVEARDCNEGRCWSWDLRMQCSVLQTLRGDKVSMLTHIYPTNPRGTCKWPYAITRLTALFTCSLMFVLWLYVTPNVVAETRYHKVKQNSNSVLQEFCNNNALNLFPAVQHERAPRCYQYRRDSPEPEVMKDTRMPQLHHSAFPPSALWEHAR